MNNSNPIKPMGMLFSCAIYIPAAILIYCLTKYLIPVLSEVTGQETVLFWFIVGGLGIFLPLIITGIILLKTEGNSLSLTTWKDRLRFSKVTKRDLLWSIGGLLAIGILSKLIMDGLAFVIGEFDHSPPFMSFETLSAGRYWLLAVWAPYWILNIMGEEFLWRGVMIPRQEQAFGKWTWLIHGTGWGLFHIAFGWQLLITLLPILYIQSYIVQKTKNSWTGVIIHGGLNGPAFIAISLGFI